MLVEQTERLVVKLWTLYVSWDLTLMISYCLRRGNETLFDYV